LGCLHKQNRCFENNYELTNIILNLKINKNNNLNNNEYKNENWNSRIRELINYINNTKIIDYECIKNKHRHVKYFEYIENKTLNDYYSRLTMSAKKLRFPLNKYTINLLKKIFYK
jgi:hypothetical protein